MYHGTHHFAAYQTFRHFAVSFFLIALSAAILFLAGYFINAPWQTIASALGLSLGRLFAGYVLSLVVGVALALAIGASATLGVRALPIFDVLQNIPSFALIPLFIAFFGYGSLMIVLFAATSIVWPIMFYAASAILGARDELSDAAYVFGARGFNRIFHYLVPLSFPAIITGSIVGISIGWEAVIGGEIIAQTPGIGSFLNTAGDAGDNRLLAVGILALLFIVFIISRVVWVPLLRSARKYTEA